MVRDGEGGSDVEPGTFARTGNVWPGRWTGLSTSSSATASVDMKDIGESRG
jgi:hypothetical protein